jgi:hypothetical protein
MLTSFIACMDARQRELLSLRPFMGPRGNRSAGGRTATTAIGERPVSKLFLAVGDYVINPQLVSYAFLERDSPEPRLRVGFAAHASTHSPELLLSGDESKELLRWLRLNATFLTRGGGFGSIGNASATSTADQANSPPPPDRSEVSRGWESISVRHSEESANFFSQALD